MYLKNNFEMYCTLSAKHVNGFSFSLMSYLGGDSTEGIVFNSWVDVADELVVDDVFVQYSTRGIDFGLRNRIQKVAPSNIGINIIMSIVLTGVTPNVISPAYDTAPIIPAPPVPEDHVDMTFLEFIFQIKFMYANR